MEKGVYIRPMSSDIKGLWNLSVGDGTSIPKGSTIYCTDAECTIGKKELFGPKPTIITGDHRIDIMGKYIADVTVEDKFVDGGNVYDQPVVIEDDVWCGGIPAKLIKMRFTEEEIKEHERRMKL